MSIPNRFILLAEKDLKHPLIARDHNLICDNVIFVNAFGFVFVLLCGFATRAQPDRVDKGGGCLER